MKTGYILFSLFVIFCTSRGQSSVAENPALRTFLQGTAVRSALVGVYVYDDSVKKEIADFQSDKYFIPASNTKIVSMYVGMKLLGDSLTGIRYFENDTALFLSPTGDPSFLHPDFQSQPVVDFLKKSHKKIYLLDEGWQEKPWGVGWAWDDYNESFSAERSPLPVYGNFIRWTEEKSLTRSNAAFESTATAFSSPEISWTVRFSADTLAQTFLVQRTMDSNIFNIRLGNETEMQQDVPFITHNLNAAVELLRDTIGKIIHIYQPGKSRTDQLTESWHRMMNMSPKIYSRPVDSIFIPMMHRSDNFFAEQTLLMLSKQRLGLMNDEKIIADLLAGPLADLPQKPHWVDGSGLSRFNLFTPRDFVQLLMKCKNEFGMDRMKRILPTGGMGTLKNYYKQDSGYIFVKTGSMTGVTCLSGYVYTYRKHLLEFSILVNNHASSNGAVRHEIETYVENLRRNY